MEETTTREKKQHKAVFAIIEKPGGRSVWMKVGIAFTNSDQSLNIYLDAIPFDRKLQVRDEDVRPRTQSTGSYERTQSAGSYERALLPLDGGSIQ